MIHRLVRAVLRPLRPGDTPRPADPDLLRTQETQREIFARVEILGIEVDLARRTKHGPGAPPR